MSIFSLDATHVLITDIDNFDGIMHVFTENISGLDVGEWSRMIPGTIYLNLSDGNYYELSTDSNN